METKTLTKNDDLQKIVGKTIILIPSKKNGIVESIRFDPTENVIKDEGIIVFKFVDDLVEKFAKGNSGFDFQIVE